MVFRHKIDKKIDKFRKQDTFFSARIKWLNLVYFFFYKSQTMKINCDKASVLPKIILY